MCHSDNLRNGQEDIVCCIRIDIITCNYQKINKSGEGSHIILPWQLVCLKEINQMLFYYKIMHQYPQKCLKKMTVAKIDNMEVVKE